MLGGRMPSDRPRLPVRLDEETLERWRAFCAAHGLTLSAFAEAIGRNLPLPPSRLPPWLAKVVEEGRAVRAERDDRRPLD